MADWDLDIIVAPETVDVHIMVNEAVILVHSLKLLNLAHHFSGLSSWVMETVESMSEERRRINDAIMDVADHLPAVQEAVLQKKNLTFDDLLHIISEADPAEFVDCNLHGVRKKEDYPGDDVILKDKTTYVEHMRQLLAHKVEKGFGFDEAVWALHYDYVMNPAQMREDLIEHLHYMWDHYFEAEWRRVRPMLDEVVQAFATSDFSDMTAYEVLEAVTERNVRGKEMFDDMFQKVDSLIFIPSTHLGPYIGWGPSDYESTAVFLFGARLPQNATIKSLSLSRNELLVRLSALADETRLRILELLTQQEEICAQDFINMLDLSQSSASRHLRQLTASGYISERRRDVAKCYSLNPERIDDTIRALREFLRKG